MGSRFFWDDLFESDTKNQLVDAFRPHLMGAAILVAVLGGILLRANGVDFDWPSSK